MKNSDFTFLRVKSLMSLTDRRSTSDWSVSSVSGVQTFPAGHPGNRGSTFGGCRTEPLSTDVRPLRVLDRNPTLPPCGKLV